MDFLSILQWGMLPADLLPRELSAYQNFSAQMVRLSKQMREAAMLTIIPAQVHLEAALKPLVIANSQLEKLFASVEFVPRIPNMAEMIARDLQLPQLDTSYLTQAAKQFGVFIRTCHEGSVRLAKAGWTFPVRMAPGEMVEVLQKQSEDEIDEAFIAFYHVESEVPFLKSEVLSSSHVKDWKTLLEQCFENYEGGKYVICIPALLSILEGTIARHEGASFEKSKARREYFKSKLESCDPESLDFATWNSMDTFFANLYQNTDFATATRPASLNRHWILHGRDVPSAWRQADALRLFHALSTVCSLYND